MKTAIKYLIAGLVLAVILSSCATHQLEYYEFDRSAIKIRVYVAPDARAQASYSVDIDPEDPIGTILSVGTSVAKASQVHQAQERMDEALRSLDIRDILENEMAYYFEDAFDARIVEDATRADFDLILEVTEYGIDASGGGSSVGFILRGNARLYDSRSDERIWRDRFSSYQSVSPSIFGLPGSAGNVLSAAMLSELSTEEMAQGLEAVTRDAAWEVASEFQRDFYGSRH